MIRRALLAAAATASSPWWLPPAVIRLREGIFTLINGEEGIPVPGPGIGAEHFERLYSDPAADGRSLGAGLSDLFWYWLAPGPQMHQEHLEPGPRYRTVARTTRQALAVPLKDAERLAADRAAAVLDELPLDDVSPVRIRDLMMPIWAEAYYELVFGEPCPPRARDLIVGNADDVITALKGTSLRHMDRRDALTDYLVERLEAGESLVTLPDDEFSTLETAWYLQGAFFNTAVVQMSEAMAHLLMAVAQHPDVQDQLAAHLDDDELLDRVIDEALRVNPLFGIAHRITTAPIELPGRTLPTGSVLLFNYLAFHRTGPAPDDEFRPDRWLSLKRKDASFIPFGVTANRACPARGMAPVMMRAAAREVLRRYTLRSSASHTRSMPNRGPCLLVRRDRPRPDLRVPLARMRARDRVDDVTTSVTQLVLGSYMVWDARRKRLCATYFDEHPEHGPAPKEVVGR
ncbi:cytochrome P450 [Kineosporia sp. J2-2]|uniref:Cytochrome P450 n=1 Tax=Kineosporia corallincola TaxID=2835133 RepID=A0ABS5TSY1_9ACTN|nr:cytochrome P450 [Kineosporia corallincola]MBT0773870.1 cytochrome P450 [Kineosporia corallincola]